MKCHSHNETVAIACHTCEQAKPPDGATRIEMNEVKTARMKKVIKMLEWK